MGRGERAGVNAELGITFRCDRWGVYCDYLNNWFVYIYWLVHLTAVAIPLSRCTFLFFTPILIFFIVFILPHTSLFLPSLVTHLFCSIFLFLFFYLILTSFFHRSVFFSLQPVSLRPHARIYFPFVSFFFFFCNPHYRFFM